uniref:Uncharacterized protein n=1 Tax=Noccaea caerulescens TaxID=107243 RepID=A0A1J3FYW7_NOCCA
MILSTLKKLRLFVFRAFLSEDLISQVMILISYIQRQRNSGAHQTTRGFVERCCVFQNPTDERKPVVFVS